MRYLFVILGIVLAVAVGAVVAVLLWLLRPEVLETYVLDSVEERTGVDIDVGSLNLGLAGILLQDVVVFEPRDPEKDVDPPRVVSAKEIAVRPSWRDLILERRLVIYYAAIDGLDLEVRREASGESNLGRLIDAFTKGADDEEPIEPAPALEDPDAPAAIELDRVIVTDAKLELTDQHERPTRPLKLRLEVTRLGLRGLSDPSPARFTLDATVELGSDFQSTIKGAGTAGFSPVVIDTDLSLDDVNVDTLVPNLANPDNDDVPGPLPLEGIRVRGRLQADRVQYEGFEFTKIKAAATLDGTQLTVSQLDTTIAQGQGVITADIDFGVQGFRYVGTAKLDGVHLAQAGGLLEPIAWGRSPDPKATIDVELSMAGTTDKRLLDTIDLDGTVAIDTLDIDAAVGRYEPGEGRDVGPFDTGDGSMRLRLHVRDAYADPYLLGSVDVEATLAKSYLNVAHAVATVADGRLSVSGDVDLTRAGLGYAGSIHLTDAQVDPLTEAFDKRGWGTRTGVVGAQVTFEGGGTNPKTLLQNLNADGEFTWTDGRVANSDYLKELASITGIPGFRDLVVQNSGGKFQMRNGVFSSKRIRIWGPDAGIQTSGSIQPNLDVDAQVALGIGPNSSRELFSTGIALPYVKGENGWRFIPVNVSGNLYDPDMSVPPRAVLKSALTTVPSAGVGVVSTGLGAVRGGTRAVLEGTRAVIPGSDGVVRGGEAVVDESTGLVSGIVERGAGAVGSVFDGIGSLFDKDDQDVGSDEAKEKQR